MWYHESVKLIITLAHVEWIWCSSLQVSLGLTSIRTGSLFFLGMRPWGLWTYFLAPLALLGIFWLLAIAFWLQVMLVSFTYYHIILNVWGACKRVSLELLLLLEEINNCSPHILLLWNVFWHFLDSLAVADNRSRILQVLDGVWVW